MNLINREQHRERAGSISTRFANQMAWFTRGLSKVRNYFKQHSGQAGDSWRDPECRRISGFWIPGFTATMASDSYFCRRTSILGH